MSGWRSRACSRASTSSGARTRRSSCCCWRAVSRCFVAFRSRRRPACRSGSGVRRTNFKTFFYDVRANRRFTRVLGARFLFFLGFVSIQRFLRNLLSDVFHLSSPGAWAAGILILATVVGITGALLAGSVVDRLGRRKVAQFAAIVAAIYLIPIAVYPNLYLMLILGAILGLAGGAFAASTWAFLADEVPQGESARFYGIANYATAGAGAIGAGIFGVMIDVLNGWKYIAGYRALILIASVLLVVSMPVLPKERPNRRAARSSREGLNGRPCRETPNYFDLFASPLCSTFPSRTRPFRCFRRSYLGSCLRAASRRPSTCRCRLCRRHAESTESCRVAGPSCLFPLVAWFSPPLTTSHSS